MPEALRRSVFEGCPLPSNGRVAVAACGFATRFILRGGGGVIEPAAGAFGARPPIAPMRVDVNEARAALWLGPDEWLLVDEVVNPDIGAALEKALAKVPHALIDVSHRNCAVEISGEGAARLLNAGVNLDFDLAAFPAGMVTRTLLVKAEIVLWRREEHRFRLETTRSFGPYVAAILSKAASDQEFS
jgi:sarcosine oxidase subunit gamma